MCCTNNLYWILRFIKEQIFILWKHDGPAYPQWKRKTWKIWWNASTRSRSAHKITSSPENRRRIENQASIFTPKTPRKRKSFRKKPKTIEIETKNLEMKSVLFITWILYFSKFHKISIKLHRFEDQNSINPMFLVEISLVNSHNIHCIDRNPCVKLTNKWIDWIYSYFVSTMHCNWWKIKCWNNDQFESSNK